MGLVKARLRLGLKPTLAHFHPAHIHTHEGRRERSRRREGERGEEEDNGKEGERSKAEMVGKKERERRYGGT